MPGDGHLVIDGAHGEGGGQILRTALALAIIAGRAVTIERIRAGRRKPGLAAQHVTAVRAAAAICAAEVDGATLGSMRLRFRPTGRPAAGDYLFDVAESREGGSAGAASLVAQTVVLPALFADGPSEFRIRGGTHVPWSPPYDYLAGVWQPFLARLGIAFAARLERFGFFPAGEGEIVARVEGRGGGARASLNPVVIVERGTLRAISGRAVAANLPAHIAQRMADQARALLLDLAPRIDIRAERVHATSPGAGIFLTAEYENVACGFSALGARGKASETVAEEAAGEVIAHRASGGALDRHLADQALLPLALAPAASTFTCEAATDHLRTNAWVIGQFGFGKVEIEEPDGAPARVTVTPDGAEKA